MTDTLQNQINLLQQQVDILDNQRKQTELIVDALNSKHKQYAITRSKVFAVENWIIDHKERWDKLVQTVADNRLTTLKVCENQIILIDTFAEILAELGIEVSFKIPNNITEKNDESNNSGKV